MENMHRLRQVIPLLSCFPGGKPGGSFVSNFYSFLAVITIFFRLYYRNKLHKQMISLEKKQAIEKERTRIAIDMHDDMGAGLSRIKVLSETIKFENQKGIVDPAHLQKISSYSEEMMDKMGEIVWALNRTE